MHSLGSPALHEVLTAILGARDPHLLLVLARLLVVDLEPSQALDLALIVVLEFLSSIIDSFLEFGAVHVFRHVYIQAVVNFVLHFFIFN